MASAQRTRLENAVEETLEEMQRRGFPTTRRSQASVIVGTVERWIAERGGTIAVEMLMPTDPPEED